MVRKTLSVLLSMVLLCLCALASCGVETGDALETVSVDLTPTDELIIYNPYYLDSSHWANRAIKLFKEQYPHVNVKVELFRIDQSDSGALIEEQYGKRMSTELLAGEGPDVVFLDAQYFDNIDKLAASGYFADLNPFLEADPDFDADSYYQPLFDAGLVDGKRAFVPHRFRVYSYVSSEERLRAVGIDPARITDMVSLLEEAGKTLPLANQNPDFDGLFSLSDKLTWLDIPDVPIYEQMLSMVGSALARREAGEGYLASGALRAFLTALKPCYQYAQRWQGVTPSPYNYASRVPALWHVLNGKRLFVSCGYSADRAFYQNTLRDGIAYYRLDENLGVSGDDGRDAVQIPIETPVSVTYTNMDGEVQAIVSDALAINTSANNKANAYHFISMLLNYREENVFMAYDMISKELDIKNAAAFSDAEKLTPETDLLAYQVTDVVFENPAVVNLLKECMLPFLNDAESYESCEAALHERLRMYWGE